MKKIFVLVCFIFTVACSSIRSSDEVWIHNAQNEAIYIQIDGLSNATHHKLAIIQHGLASDMNHQAVQAAKQAFLDNNYVVITFDSRYSLGYSGNHVENARLATFNEDLKTVISWAKKQPFYSEPFALSGHSLGGGSVLQYSAEYPKDVNILVPITPVISGSLWEKSCMTNMTAFCRQWKHEGTYTYTDVKKHKTAVIPFDIITDSKSYNAFALLPQIAAKTLFIAAQNDIIISSDDLSQLAKSANPQKNITVVSESGHNFETSENQADLYKVINHFLNIK